MHFTGVKRVCMIAVCVCIYMCVMHFSFHSMEELSRINLDKHIVFACDSVSL